MKLGKRFTAWVLAGVMAFSSVPFPVSRVYAEEMVTETAEEVLETDVVESVPKSETESVYESIFKETEIQTEINEGEENTDSEHELDSVDVQEVSSEQDYEDTQPTDDRDTEHETESDFVAVQEDIGASSSQVLSGSCGDNVTFALDSDGVLTICGSGEMSNYYNTYKAPWYDKKSFVKTVVIENGVTSIGTNAFMYCSGLTSVTIPESMTSIGSGAFGGCSGLTRVTIPESVTSIGSDAFKYCSGLTSAGPIGGGYDYEFGWKEKIPSDAFKYCSGLTRVTIPESVTSIGTNAFMNCSGLTRVTIPESVTSIGSDAFKYCSGLTSAGPIGGEYDYEFGWKEKIPNNAFEYCSGLTRVTIPESVTSIGSFAFFGCSGLTRVTIPESVTSIGTKAFMNCSGLTRVTIPESVTSIGSDAFGYCSGLTSAGPIGEGYDYEFGWKEKILNNAFEDCSGLTRVTIPESVTSIGGSAFEGCSGLTSVIIPESVTSIGSSAFEGCSGLTRVTIPESVTSIGTKAFMYCSGLTRVTIPESVTSIGSDAFGYCSGLTSAGPIGEGYDYEFGWKEKIPSNAFMCCSGLTSVAISESVTSIGNGAFEGCNLTDVFYGGNEEDWTKISVGPLNSVLTNATIHYNSTMPDIPSIDNISAFTLPNTATGAVSNTISISGEITLSDDTEVSSSLLDAAVKSITWTSSDKEVAEVTNCTGTNVDDNHSATLSITVTPYKAGTVTITGTTSNGITASCEVTIEEGGTASGIVSEFTLKSSVAGTLDDTIGISGRLKLSADAEVSSDIIQKEIDSIQWTTSDPKIAKVTKCVGLKSVDNRTAELMITVTPYKGGTVTITGETSTGVKKICSLIVEPKMVLEAENLNSNTERKIKCTITNNVADKNYLKNFMENISYSWTDSPTALKFISGNYEISTDEKSAVYTLTVLPAENNSKTTITFTSQGGIEEKVTKPVDVWSSWGFKNYTVDRVPVTEEFYEKYWAGLNYSDRKELHSLISARHGGQCHGMAVLSLLVDQDLTSLDTIEKNAEALYEVEKSETAKKLIGWYYLGQWTVDILEADRLFRKMSVSQQLRIISHMGSPFILSFGSDMGGHSVVGYAIESGSWTKHKNLYNKRVVIYDSNYPQGAEGDEYLYFNEETGTWEIPCYYDDRAKFCSDKGGELWSAIANLSTISSLDFTNFSAWKDGKDSTWIRSNNNMYFMLKTDKDYYEIGSKDYALKDEIFVTKDKDFNLDMPDQVPITNVYLEGNTKISILPNKATDTLDYSVLYNNTSFINAKVSSYESAEFSKEGTVKLSGIAGEYDIDLTVDNSSFSNSSIKISGNGAAEVSAETTKEGVIVRGDNLQNVNVTVYDVNDDTKEIKVPVSSSKDSILIEEEGKKIIISEDSNDDGIYDKKIAESSNEDFEEKIKYKVIFDTQIQGAIPTTYTDIVEGSTINPPTAPTAEGYTFTGWYKDVNCTTLWNFATDTVTSDITLYAGWKSVSDEPDIPNEPNNPDTPDNPDNPDTPDNPDNPDNPDTSDEPDIPANPDNPSIGDVLPSDIPADGRIPDGLWIAGMKEYTYNGRPIKPDIHIYYGNTRLKEGWDYTVSYKNNTKAATATDAKAPRITVKCKNGYTETVSANFTIKRRTLTESNLIYTPTYQSGKTYTPVLVANGNLLKVKTDYTITYKKDGVTVKSPKKEGNYEIFIQGKNSCEGSFTVPYTVLDGKTTSIVKAKIKIGQMKYGDKPPKAVLTISGQTLIENTDYTVTYANTNAKGTATVICKGIGKYSGVVKKTFKVTAAKLPSNCITVNGDTTLKKGGAKPQVTVSVNGVMLTAGTDYTVRYKNNKKAGKTAVVTVKGKGNYSGSAKKTFVVENSKVQTKSD